MKKVNRRWKKMVLAFGFVIMSISSMQVRADTETASGQTEEQVSDMDANMTAATLVANTQQKMNSIMVYQADISVTMIANLKVATDRNSGITYMKMNTEEMWIDSATQIIYTYDSATGKVEFEPMSAEDVATMQSAQLQANQLIPTAQYEYLGIQPYNGQQCYVAKGKQTSNGTTMEVNLYIDKDFQLVGMITTYEGVPVIVQMSYPASVTIPDNIRASARLADGYSLEWQNVSYRVEYVKNQAVLKAIGAVKDKSKLQIADTVTICGVQYPVYEIDKNAFTGSKKLKTVIIGKNVQKIGKSAFAQCKKLKEVKIKSKKIKKIDKNAFHQTAKTLKVKAPKKKMEKYETLLKKSKVTAILKMNKL